MEDPPAIETQGLTKAFGPLQALKAVSLEVKRGEIFGFLGANGAGKTTMIRILLDLIRPTDGRAFVAGFDVQRQVIEAHRQIGYVSSDPAFYEGQNASELFALVERARGVSLDHRYLAALIERLALDPSRKISDLSRGNRQKVGLVCAFMTQAAVVILDEPTTGLDPLMQEEVGAIVKETAAAGRTVFFSSHLLPEVEKLCDRAAIVRRGELVKVFDVEEERRAAPQKAWVRFRAPVDAAMLARVPGVAVTASEGETRFELAVRSNIDGFVKFLAGFEVEELQIAEATLEDLFISYYESAAAEVPS